MKREFWTGTKTCEVPYRTIILRLKGLDSLDRLYHVVNYSVVFVSSTRTKMLVHGVNFVLYSFWVLYFLDGEGVLEAILIVLKYHVAAG